MTCVETEIVLQTRRECTDKGADGCAETGSPRGQPPPQVVDAEHGEDAGRKLKAAHQARAREDVELEAEVQQHIGMVQCHDQ